MIQYNNQRFDSLIVTYKFGETNRLNCRNKFFLFIKGGIIMKNNFNEKLDVFMMTISSLFAVALIIYLFYSILSQISTINEFGTLATLAILSLFLAFIVFETIKWD